MIPGLGLSAAELGQMRREQTALLPDLVEIRKPGEMVDNGTGQDVYQPGDIAVTYKGKDQIPARLAYSDNTTTATQTPIAGQDVSTHRYMVTLPFDVAAPMVGIDIIPVQSADPFFLTRTLRVMDETGQSFVTGRRLVCEQVTTP